MLSSNVPFEEFVLRSLSASLLRKPFFTPNGWHVVKNVYSIVSIVFKWVALSRTDSLMNLSPMWIVVSNKVVSVHDVSAVNFIVLWNLFACSMNCSTSSLLVFQRKEISSMLRFQTSSLFALLSTIFAFQFSP